MRGFVLITVITVLAIWIVYEPAVRFFRIDSCLDRGGAWDDGEDRCRGPAAEGREDGSTDVSSASRDGLIPE